MRAWWLILLVLVGLASSACAKAQTDTDRVNAFLDQSERVARSFQYSDRGAGAGVAVSGVIADDLRYRAEMVAGGQPAGAEVVVDDARALQVIDQRFVQGLVRSSAPPPPAVANAFGPAASPTPPASPSPSASPPAGSPVPTPAPGSAALVQLPAPLLQGAWVVDPRGARSLTSATAVGYTVGDDPMFDALNVVAYVRLSLQQGASVNRFNPESPYYRPKVDPFPRPTAGVERYDIYPPSLQPRGTTTLGSASQLPDINYFRVMSVYVKDGLVVDVRERISVQDRLLDPMSNFAARISDYVKVPPGTSIAAQARLLLNRLNQQRTAMNQGAIRERDMRVTFSRYGQAAEVSIPATAIPGDLSRIAYHGQVLRATGRGTTR